jgi:trehalose 6-phosphate phosphatase
MRKQPGSNNDQLHNFFSHFSQTTNALLLLDYDGTLAPFRVDRFKARPWSGVPELLNRIQDCRRVTTRIIFISGRPAAEIAPLLGLERPIEVWGLHGAEHLHPDGRRELQEPPLATRSKLEELKDILQRDSFGGLFENKPNAAVMHWRGVSPAKVKEIARKTRALFDPLAKLEGLTLLEFESGLELRSGRDKGGAVEAILAAEDFHELTSPVAFLGDDITDESAFIAVNASQRPHLTALVKPVQRETAAAVRLKPPGELKEFLCRWIDACE